MYAVVETGGKQYRVSPGDIVEVELLPAEPGATVTLDRVLLVSHEGETQVGAPVVPGATVVATVIGEGRGKKIIVFRYKSKKRYRRTTGHRQDYTYLTITDIQADGASLVAEDERKRFERIASRAANRYEARLLAAFAPVTEEEEEAAEFSDEDEDTDEALDEAEDEESEDEESEDESDDEDDEAEDDESDAEDAEVSDEADVAPEAEEPEPPAPSKKNPSTGRSRGKK